MRLHYKVADNTLIYIIRYNPRRFAILKINSLALYDLYFIEPIDFIRLK